MDELHRQLTLAFICAIEAMGLTEFKKTSMFGRRRGA